MICVCIRKWNQSLNNREEKETWNFPSQDWERKIWVIFRDRDSCKYTMREGQKTTRELLGIYLRNAEHNRLTICNLIKILKFIEDSLLDHIKVVSHQGKVVSHQGKVVRMGKSCKSSWKSCKDEDEDDLQLLQLTTFTSSLQLIYKSIQILFFRLTTCLYTQSSLLSSSSYFSSSSFSSSSSSSS